MKQHTPRRRRGLTLVEVVVTAVLILGVFALAAPTFTGNRGSAEADARATVSAALDAQVTTRDRLGAFSTDPAALDDLTPRRSHTTAESGGPSQISVAVDTTTVSGATRDRVGVAVRADSGSCWLAQVVEGSGTLYAVSDTAAVCNGALALTVAPDPADPGRGESPLEPIEL